MKQMDVPELLDTDSGTAKEIADSLLDLRGINQRYGGVATMAAMIDRVSRKCDARTFTVLEVAAGSGYVPQTAGEALKKRGIQIQVTLLDRAQSHLPSKAGSRELNRIPASAVVADALNLPFEQSSFDLVGCNLFAHHLLPAELVKFVNEALRVCRTAVLINDIVRSPLHLALVYAGSISFRSRITRHDAAASVRRAYTADEMKTILTGGTAAQIEIQRHYLYRMAVIAWKQIPSA